VGFCQGYRIAVSFLHLSQRQTERRIQQMAIICHPFRKLNAGDLRSHMDIAEINAVIAIGV
jgi:hypothetical protein